MIHAPKLTLFALVSFLAAGHGLAAPEKDKVYFCQNADGSIVLQTDPCPEPIDTEEVPEPPAPRRPAERLPSPPSPSPPPPRTSVQVEATAPPPVRRSTSGWILVPRSSSTRTIPGSTLGKQSFPTRLGPGSTPSDPSFASPELTWRTFVAAIETGDRIAAGSCLTPAALERLGSDVGSIPLGDLRSMLETFTRIESGGDLGPFWSILGVRSNQRPKWIFFEQVAPGEWKIAGI